MRKAGIYEPPKYRDSNDERLVQLIVPAKHSMPRALNIIGIPFDGAVLGRRGAAGGPAAIRRGLSAFSNFNIELGIGLRRARVYDLGDLVMDPDDVSMAHRAIEAEVHEAIQASSLLAVLGGDNSISLPSLRALAGRFRKIGLVVVDTHLDLRGEIGGRPTSGSSYGLAIKSIPGLAAGRVSEIGVHGFLNSEPYAKMARSQGIGVFTADEVRRSGADDVARRAYQKAADGSEAVYLSVDMDAVDLAWVPGVSAPSAGGITAAELLQMVYSITRMPLVKCLDIVELAPSLDPSGRSQVVAATALTYALAGFCSRSRPVREGRVRTVGPRGRPC